MTTRTVIEADVPRSLAESNTNPRGRVFPSPVNWRDQILYQLLPDRFSDGREAGRPLFDRDRPEQFQVKARAVWMAAGLRFNGGTLKGIASKLDYLQNLGVTTLWLNPPWKQRADLETYHGYGIQNFLDIDPRFGTRQDLRDLVDEAHDRGMYVVLDIIYNHTGNNWFYRDEATGEPRETMAYRAGQPYPLLGWRDRHGHCIPQPSDKEDGIWPVQFQDPDSYVRKGSIGRWDVAGWEDPMAPGVEFRQGDFFDLKKLHTDSEQTVNHLAFAYIYWIALSDCDGFRVDAVKHVGKTASRRFCRIIKAYTQEIGKDNFLLVGEITDSHMAVNYMEVKGLNLDAVLDIAGTPNNLMGMVKGQADPLTFFSGYAESDPGGLMRRVGDYFVSVIDDHDMSSRTRKERLAAHNTIPSRYLQSAHAVGVQLTIPAIPSIYYGTEQAFDGSEDDQDYIVEPRRFGEDRYVRECMFGGPFGAFRTTGCHFFNPDHPVYLRIAALARLRNGQNSVGRVLRRGVLLPRQTSYAGKPFGWPPRGELVAWGMLLYNREVLMVLNTHGMEARGADVTIDNTLHPDGSRLVYLYRGDWSDAELRKPPPNQHETGKHQPDGRATVRIELPPAGMAVLTRA